MALLIGSSHLDVGEGQTTFNIVNFGAVGDGKTDDSGSGRGRRLIGRGPDNAAKAPPWAPSFSIFVLVLTLGIEPFTLENNANLIVGLCFIEAFFGGKEEFNPEYVIMMPEPRFGLHRK
ncbi:putative polygalacturonase [Corchorus capsularis]|uniref:Putative polygalacturonase n=1 Tax=Corchorus capsularis TaxID=210143 RepID=A0A1R3FVU3_COCAP|nr:putative polygalacturonase [Corchorus capsularis]